MAALHTASTIKNEIWQKPSFTNVSFSYVEIETIAKHCSFDSMYAFKQGHFWPCWPRVLSKDVDLHASFGNVKNSFSKKYQISTT